MKRLLAVLLALSLYTPIPVFADFAGSGFSPAPLPSQTGNSGKYLTTNGSVASWGTVSGTGTGTITGPAVATQDNVACWGADNVTLKDCGVSLSAYAPLVSPSFTTPDLGVASATTLNTGQGAYELYAMDQNVRTTDNVTFGIVTATEFVSNAADNTRGVTVPNPADPTTTNLADGKCWYNTTSETWKCRGLDNTASVTMSQVYKYYRVAIDAPTTADNVVFDGPIPFAQTWDNVLILVQDNTGKLSGSASDNATVNLSYCSSIATPTCTNVFSSNQTATGAAILTPALNNTAPSAADYLRVTISAANMANKKLYIRARYRE